MHIAIAKALTFKIIVLKLIASARGIHRIVESRIKIIWIFDYPLPSAIMLLLTPKLSCVTLGA